MISSLFSNLFLVLVIGLFGCTSGPVPFKSGKDQCDHCKMVISDVRFAAQIETQKGKIFKFDDMRCMVDYANGGKIKKADIKNYYVTDFMNKKNILNCKDAFYYASADFKSPMNGNIAAFATQSDVKKVAPTFSGKEMKWSEILK